MNLLTLFWAFLKIGFFTIGGGYASLPLVQDVAVEGGLITYDEFADMIAIAEMTPGPIALNVATFVGAKLGGFAGSVLATLGFITLPFLIVLLLALLYYRYKNLRIIDNVLKTLRPAVSALIVSAGAAIVTFAVTQGRGLILTIGAVDMFAVGGIVLCVAVLRIKKIKVNPIFVMLAAGVCGGAYYYFAA